MKRLKFPIAVAITSLALVAAVAAIAVVTLPLGAFAATSALASTLGATGPRFGPPGFSGPGFKLPSELQALADLPPAERFAHFVGVQVNLKDKDNRPLTLNVTPGTTTAASANSLTIAANDGSSKTFTLDDKTAIRGKPAQGSSQAAQQSPANGDKVIVITTNNDQTAKAVINVGDGDFGPGGFGGPPWARWGNHDW